MSVENYLDEGKFGNMKANEYVKQQTSVYRYHTFICINLAVYTGF